MLHSLQIRLQLLHHLFRLCVFLLRSACKELSYELSGVVRLNCKDIVKMSKYR